MPYLCLFFLFLPGPTHNSPLNTFLFFFFLTNENDKLLVHRIYSKKQIKNGPVEKQRQHFQAVHINHHLLTRAPSPSSTEIAQHFSSSNLCLHLHVTIISTNTKIKFKIKTNIKIHYPQRNKILLFYFFTFQEVLRIVHTFWDDKRNSRMSHVGGWEQ